MDNAGNGVAVWVIRDGSSNTIVQGSYRPAGAGSAFTSPVSLSVAGQNAQRPQVAFDSSCVGRSAQPGLRRVRSLRRGTRDEQHQRAQDAN